MKPTHFFTLLLSAALSACGGGGGTSSPAIYSAILGLALDDPANPSKLYVANADNHTLQTLALSGLSVSTLAGGANTSGSTDGTGTAAKFNAPYAITRVSSTEFYVADTYNHGIRKLTSAGVVSTLAGSLGTAGSADGTGAAATFRTPKGLTNDGTYLYVADTYNQTIRKVTISSGAVTTLAGYAGTTGAVDDASGANARFNYPFSLVAEGGNVYVSDTGNNSLRKITAAGAVSTLAGSTAGTAGSENGTGTVAKFDAPTGIVSDGTHLYVADTNNHTIRKVVISSGVVSTLAGSAGSAGSADGTGAAARFNTPIGLALDSAGNLYVSDQRYTKIRKVDTSTGAVTTVNASF